MLAFRLTLKIKPGCMDKAVELAQSVKFAPDWKGRIYVSEGGYGPRDTLIFEETYESVAEREAYWEQKFGTPEFSAWWDEWWNEVAESGGRNGY